MEQFKHAIVYGQSVKHQPQRVGLSHELADEDISKWNTAQHFCQVLSIDSNDHKTIKLELESTQRRGKRAARRCTHSS